MFGGDFGARLKGSFLSSGGNKKKTGQVNKGKLEGTATEEAKVSAPLKTSPSVPLPSSSPIRSVPLRDLPADALLPILEKAELSSLCKMQRASRSINSIVEANKKEIFKHRKDNISLAIPIEEKRFMMFVNKTRLVDPAKQLFGINVEKVEIYFGVPKASALTMKSLLSTVKAFSLSLETVDVDWEQYPLCGTLYFLRNSDILMRGSVKENVDRLMEELLRINNPRLIPHFSIEEHCTTSLPMYLRLVWTTPLDYEFVRRNKLPVDIHVMVLPSDDLFIAFNHSIDVKPIKPSSFRGDYFGQFLKVWIVKNEPSEIQKTVKEAFPDDEKHNDAIAEVIKNMNAFLTNPDEFIY